MLFFTLNRDKGGDDETDKKRGCCLCSGWKRRGRKNRIGRCEKMVKKKKSILKKLLCIFSKTSLNDEVDSSKENNEKLIEALESGSTGDKD